MLPENADEKLHSSLDALIAPIADLHGASDDGDQSKVEVNPKRVQSAYWEVQDQHPENLSHRP